jgi:hypothetical protein
VYLGIPGFFELSVDHWIKDGLLAIFFFVVAVELQYELTSGELNSARKATQPAIAAAGGILVPIAVLLLFAGGTESASGWPVPTATDIAFALGVLAVFGRGLPPALRVFLLALAILDDIVGIVFIAVLFTSGVNVGMLALAAIGIVAFGILSRQLDGRARRPVAVALVVVAVLTWAFVYASGVHATIAGVALGLAMAQHPALRARHALEPWVNGLVLPLFAFSAALVVIPAVSPAQLQPAFWGVAVALPVGKLVGISLFGWSRSGSAARRAPPRRCRSPICWRRRPRRHRIHGVAAARRARVRGRCPVARRGDPGGPRGVRRRAGAGQRARVGTLRALSRRARAGSPLSRTRSRGGIRVTASREPIRRARRTRSAKRRHDARGAGALRLVAAHHARRPRAVPRGGVGGARRRRRDRNARRPARRTRRPALAGAVPRGGRRGGPDDPFTIDDVAAGLVEKMVRRHPHVFADAVATTPEEVLVHWNAAKAAEKRDAALGARRRRAAHALLALAQKLLGRAARSA